MVAGHKREHAGPERRRVGRGRAGAGPAGGPLAPAGRGAILWPRPSRTPLSPAAAYVRAFDRFADFDGRASRAAYWGFWAVHAGLTLVLTAASAVVGTSLDAAWIAGSAVVALYLVLGFFPALSATARRLHDVGRSSWLVALVALPPLGLLVLYWCVLPGEPAPNAWGQPSGPEG